MANGYGGEGPKVMGRDIMGHEGGERNGCAVCIKCMTKRTTVT